MSGSLQLLSRWLERPSAVLVLISLIEACLLLMGVMRFQPVFASVAGVAGLVLVAALAARWLAWRESRFSGECSRFQPFNQLHLAILGLLIVIAVAYCLPIWSHHYGDGGWHGHPGWDRPHMH